MNRAIAAGALLFAFSVGAICGWNGREAEPEGADTKGHTSGGNGRGNKPVPPQLSVGELSRLTGAKVWEYRIPE